MLLLNLFKGKQNYYNFFKNNGSEFCAKFDNHSLGNQNIYRFYFIEYYRISDGHEMNSDNIAVFKAPFESFMLPDNMSREDAFKILSYYADFFDKNFDVKLCSYKSVSILNNIIDVHALGFKRVNINFGNDSDDVINLFTVSGRISLFKNSKLYNKYFDWYTKDVSFEDLKDIYDKYNIKFDDVLNNNGNVLV